MPRVCLVVCCLCLCAAPAAAQEPEWLKTARAREGGDVTPQAVRSKDGVYSATVVGKVEGGAIVQYGGIFTVTIDIGSGSPAVCEIRPAGFDLAGILQATAHLTFKEFERLGGTIDVRALERIDSGAYGGHPFIALDWLFRMSDGKRATVSAVKQVAIARGSHRVYCAHMEVGYSRSFESAVRSLVESLRVAGDEPAPFFTEISTMRLQNHKVGVAVITMEHDKHGDTVVRTSAALVVPVTPDTLQVEDSTHIQSVRPDGTLISAAHIAGSGKEVETMLDLRPAGEGKWQISGKFEGKEIERTLDSPPPTTVIQEARARRELFGRKDVIGTKLTTTAWTTADPTRILSSQTTVVSVLDADHVAARETMEGISTDVMLERTTGLPSRSVLELGPATVQVDRVYVQGSF